MTGIQLALLVAVPLVGVVIGRRWARAEQRHEGQHARELRAIDIDNEAERDDDDE